MGRRARRKALEAYNATTTTTTTTPIPQPLPTDKLTIEICIHCFFYQHRLTWMLNSLVQQKQEHNDLPNIIVNISHTTEDGSPTTEEVCKFFRERGLNIKETLVTKENVCNRGKARNMQVKETTSDYMLFADSDLVYDPYFFEDLHRQIKDKLWSIKLVMGADRYSLNDSFCIDLFEKDSRTYPCEIPNVAEIAKGIPIKWKNGKHVAPGFFQLARTSIIKAKGNTYVARSRDLWRGTYSDRQFRKKMGGRIGIDVKPQWHLNHDRKGPELQR